MKVSQAHYKMMSKAITDMPLNPSMRERWDAMWRAIDGKSLSWDVLKPYNDDHIDTALRAISREMN